MQSPLGDYTPLQSPLGDYTPPCRAIFFSNFFFRYEKNCFSETRPYGVYKRFEALKKKFEIFSGTFFGGAHFRDFFGNFFFLALHPLAVTP